MQYHFLPPYSPDYNPIELAFAAIKAHIRRNKEAFEALSAQVRDGDDTPIYMFLHDAVFSVTPQDALGWFRGCNYV